MNIKRYILNLGALAMLLPSCYELEEPFEKVRDGISKEITAILEETRTAIDDGWNASWVNGDQMIVYVTRTNKSNKPYGYSPFKYSEGGTFSGTVNKDFCSPWNWFAVYPTTQNSSSTSSSASPEVTHPASQKMTGSSNAHIAGANDPLYGYAVGEKDNPSIRMHHISSMVEFHITNGNDLPIQVTKIEFTAPKNIVGTYKANMDLWANTVKEPTWSESKNLGKTISTKLTFNAGKIKTLNFTFTAEIPDPLVIENPKLAAYLDSVETHPYFTGNTFGSYSTSYSSSLMKTYLFYDGNGSDNRLDQPSPVQLSWTGSATKVEVFNSPSKTENDKVAEVQVSNTTAASIYNLIPGATQRPRKYSSRQWE